MAYTTLKLQLLEFIEEHVNETNMLRILERVEYVGKGGIINIKDKGRKRFDTTKENLIRLINENYTDKLFGKLPNETMIIEILDWAVIPRIGGVL